MWGQHCHARHLLLWRQDRTWGHKIGQVIRQVFAVPVSLLAILIRARWDGIGDGKLVPVLNAPSHDLHKSLDHPPAA